MEECRYIALQLEKGGYESIPEAKEPGLLEAAEFRLLVQQALSSYRPGPSRRWRLGIAWALQSNARHFPGLEGMAVSTPSPPPMPSLAPGLAVEEPIQLTPGRGHGRRAEAADSAHPREGR